MADPASMEQLALAALDHLAQQLGVIPEMFALLPSGGSPSAPPSARWALGSAPDPGWIYLVKIEAGVATIEEKWQAQPGEIIFQMWRRAAYITESGIGTMR